jgi:endonuclease YncB( thermonuclease family)
MAGRGYGQVVAGAPNTRYADLLLKRQEEARASRLGIWKNAGPPPPPARR